MGLFSFEPADKLIASLFICKGFWDRQGTNIVRRYKKKYCGELISTSKKRFQRREINTFFGHGFIRNQFVQFLYMANVTFCLNTRETSDKIS